MEAHIPFNELLRQTSEHKGITVGGYRTHELDPKWREKRGGLAAKGLLEATIRCYASGVFRSYEPLQALLEGFPRLQIRSEIFAIHVDCWERLRRANPCRLIIEPVEATIQLVIGALLEGWRRRAG
jgi:hypothetical protein